MIEGHASPTPPSPELAYAILDSLDVALTCYDADDRLVWWNTAAEILFPKARHTLVAGMRAEERDQANEQAGYNPASRSSRAEAPALDIEEWNLPDGRRMVRQRLRLASGNQVLSYVDISRQLSAESKAVAALEAERERYALMVEGTQDGLYDRDMVAGTTWYSLRCHEMLGLPDGALNGDRSAMLARLHPDDAGPYNQSLQAAYARRAPVSTDIRRLKHADGRWRWIASRARILYSESGTPLRTVGSWMDVSAQKEAEERLRASEERYALVVEGASQGIYDQDFEKGTIWFTARAHDMLGLADGTLNGSRQALTERIHPEDLKAHDEALAEAASRREPSLSTVARMRHADGSWRWIASRVRVVYGADGALVRTLGSLNDITQQRKTEEALRLSEERYSLVVDGSREGITDRDIAGNTIWLSPRIHEMLGLPDGALNGDRAKWMALAHPADLEIVQAKQDETIDRRDPYHQGLLRLRHADGGWRWIASRARFIYADDGTPVRAVGSWSDVTEEQEAKEELKRLNRDLEKTVVERTAHLEREVAERRAAEQAAAVAERRLGLILDNLPVGVSVTDSGGRVIIANKQAISLGFTVASGEATMPREQRARIWLKNARIYSINGQQLDAADLEPERNLRKYLDAANAGTLTSWEGQTSDGRTIHSVRRRLEGGLTVSIQADITALKVAERRLQSAIDAVDDSFALWGSDDRLAICNSAYRAELAALGIGQPDGLTYTSLVKRIWDTGLPASDGLSESEWTAQRHQAHREADGRPAEFKRRGRILQQRVFRAETGDIVRITSDVTAIRAAEMKLKGLFDVLPVGVSILDSDGRQTESNRAFADIYSEIPAEELTRYSKEEQVYHEKTEYRLEHEDRRPFSGSERAEWLQRRAESIKGGVPEPAELRTSLGRHVRIVSARLDDGRLIQVHQDVTDVRAAEDRIRMILDNLPIGIMVFNQQGSVVVTNKAQADLLPVSPDAIRQTASLDERLKRFLGYAEVFSINDKILSAEDRSLDRAFSLITEAAADRRLAFLEARTRWGRVLRVTPTRLNSDLLAVIYSDVTEIRRAERRLSDAIEATGDSFALFDRDDRIALWNNTYSDRLRKFVGYEVQAGDSYADILAHIWRAHPVDGMTREDYIETGLARHREADGVPREDHRYGGWRRNRVSRTASGEIVYTGVDVTELRQAEIRLKEAIDAIGDRFALYDRDERLVLWNDAFQARIADRELPELHQGMPLADLLRTRWQRNPLEGATEQEYVNRMVQLHREAAGQSIETEHNGAWTRSRVSRTASNEIVYLATDITELRRAQEELERLLSENRQLSAAELARRSQLLQSVMDTVTDGLVVVSDHSGAVFWNRAFVRLSGLSGTAGPDNVGSPSRASMSELLNSFRLAPERLSALVSGESDEEECAVGGRGVFVLRILRIGEGSSLLWVSDVSQRREEESERMALQERLLESLKGDSIAAMAGTVAHDFNNLLTIVGGFASLSLSQLDVLKTLPAKLPTADPQAQRTVGHVIKAAESIAKSLGNIVSGASRGKAIVANLTAFAKGRPSDLAVSDLSETMESATKLIGASLPASVTFTTKGIGESQAVRHDRTKIEQVLFNLCINSSHAIANCAGAISVVMSRVDVDGGRASGLGSTGGDEGTEETKKVVIREGSDGWTDLWRGLLVPAPFVKIDVRDSGSGMDAETMKKIFDPFFTTKPQGQGTGLGLLSVSRIVEEHGGVIHVRSRKGEGTVFSILLPLAEAGAMPVETGQMAVEYPEVEDAGLGLAKAEHLVMVVDDEGHLTELIQLALERSGLAVEVFNDPEIALGRFQADPAAFALVITDQTMPGITGMELAARIASLNGDVPVLLCTGYSAKTIEEDKLPRGISAVMRKPFVPSELVAKVREILDLPR